MASIVNLIIYMYSIFCMDVIKWGKTRQLKNNSDEYTFDDTIYATIDSNNTIDNIFWLTDDDV